MKKTAAVLADKPATPCSCGPPALVALLAMMAVLYTIDPAGDYPAAAEGPGVTLDELFNVEQGAYLVESVRAFGLGLLHPESVEEVFGDRAYLPDHPPLGRLWIGLFHKLTRWVAPPVQHESPFATASARTASAAAFGVSVFLVGWIATKWYGRAGGVLAAASLLLMPRLFGHAHLAALETVIGLTYTAAVLCIASTWTAQKRISRKTAGLAGVVFGLALLTKIQAILLPAPIALWALFHWRHRAIVPLIVWGLAGGLVFFLCWPWLWLDPIAHLKEYFGRTTDRIELYTWYFGNRYADRSVPWHYPVVMFLATVPVGLHFLGLLGVFLRKRPAWKEPREQLLLACLLFPLLVFSLPGVAVYDGARLFLVVFPIWAVLIGRGSAEALAWLKTKVSRPIVAGSALALFFAGQGYGVLVMAPCHLSYYNLLVGGLWGAERLGLETTYWGDSITREFLYSTVKAVPEGATVHVSPVLHRFQLAELLAQSPILRRHGVNLRPFDADKNLQARYLLIFRRQSDLPDVLRRLPPAAKLLAEVTRQGVQLTALYALSP